MFINPVSEAKATGKSADMYRAAQAENGFVPNVVKIFGDRPELMDLWEGLLAGIRGNLDLRRYELATLGAARALNNSYCMLAHSTNLMRNGVSAETLTDMGKTGDAADLTDQERLIMAYTAKIATDASSVTQSDIDGLRATGLTDAEIFDIAATACIRCFIAKLVDALGAAPDNAFMSLDKTLREALTVGRAIEPANTDTDQIPA